MKSSKLLACAATILIGSAAYAQGGTFTTNVTVTASGQGGPFRVTAKVAGPPPVQSMMQQCVADKAPANGGCARSSPTGDAAGSAPQATGSNDVAPAPDTLAKSDGHNHDSSSPPGTVHAPGNDDFENIAGFLTNKNKAKQVRAQLEAADALNSAKQTIEQIEAANAEAAAAAKAKAANALNALQSLFSSPPAAPPVTPVVQPPVVQAPIPETPPAPKGPPADFAALARDLSSAVKELQNANDAQMNAKNADDHRAAAARVDAAKAKVTEVQARIDAANR